jgi:EAL domain-containing protein (putative c-di-GMP-specific phosphodiesterase class I)
LRQALAEPFNLEGHQVFSGVSIGIATSPNGLTATDYLRAADTAMYRAKARGTGFEVFDTAMHTEAIERLEIETGLRQALERDELRVHYQPVVSLQAGRATIGFEALVRWQHPKRGLLMPDAFLPVAEETQLIAEIDAWVLRMACAQASTWATAPHEPARTLSVNLSSRSLAELNLAERIETVLAETGFAPQRLRLEITETALIKGGEHLQTALRRLRDQGIAILLDDFGQGYSSLSYLHRFPIDTLKIDRAFVHDLVGSGGLPGTSAEIVQTIIALAHNMGINVIAEGIETQDQLHRLRALGCEYGQGYLFARPMDAVSVTEWDLQLALI